MKSSTSNHSGTRLFFIEFLIVLFFFLIISTVFWMIQGLIR